MLSRDEYNNFKPYRNIVFSVKESLPRACGIMALNLLKFMHVMSIYIEREITMKTVIVTKLSQTKLRIPCKHCDASWSFALKKEIPKGLVINCMACNMKINGAYDVLTRLKRLSERTEPEVFIETALET